MPMAVLPSIYSSGTSKPADLKANLPKVFFITCTSPPASRTRLRNSSKAGIVRPVYSVRNTASDFFSQSSYSATMACLRSLERAKSKPPRKTKVFASSSEAKTPKQQAATGPLPRQGIKRQNPPLLSPEERRQWAAKTSARLYYKSSLCQANALGLQRIDA